MIRAYHKNSSDLFDELIIDNFTAPLLSSAIVAANFGGVREGVAA